MHSDEVYIITFSSLALLGPGAFRSPSDVMRRCDIFCGNINHEMVAKVIFLNKKYTK